MADDGNNHNQGNSTSIPMDDPMRAGMHSLLEGDMFIDYKIKVEDREFKVHKLVMSSMSDYFKIMLSGDLAESKQDSVVIEGVGLSADIMEILIHFIYTSHMDISEDNAADILGGAVYFQMKSAIKICTQYLIDTLDPVNWFDVLMLFKSYALSAAVEDVERYIREHISEIAKADSNMKLQYHNLCFIVQNWQSSECDLFSFILKWVKAEREERKQYVGELLCSVRYSLMTRQQLSEIRLCVRLMTEFDGTSVVSLIDRALEYHKLPLHERVLDDSEQSKVRFPPSFVNIANTQCTPGTIGHFYDPLIKERFVEHKGLTSPTSYQIGPTSPCENMVVNNFLIVHEPSSNEKVKFHIFDPRTMKWERMSDLHSNMLGTILIHDNTHLYAIGGLDPGTPVQLLDSIVRYDFQTNLWSEFDRLQDPPLFPGACVYNNSLYVSGGITGLHVPEMLEFDDEVDPNDVQSTFNRLDLSTHQWQTKAPMLVPEYAHEMHVMKVLGEDHLCIINSEFNMQVYCLSRDFWTTIDFVFDKPLLQFQGRGEVKSWFVGNSVYMIEYDSDTGNMIYYQKITIPEEGWHGHVEHIKYYGGHYIWGIKHVLAIAPYTTEPEFLEN